MKDLDIERWSAEWRAGAPPVVDLARMARRERRWLLTWIAFDWITGAAFIALAAWIWFEESSPGMRFVAAAVVALVLVALAFTVRNWRGSLAGDRSSASDFLALAVHRSVARRRYIRFGWGLLAANVVIIATAFAIDAASEGLERLPVLIGLTALATGAAAGILWSWGRRERRKQERLAALDRALRTGPENELE